MGALRRYAGSSVPDAKVEISYLGVKKIVESDEEGIIDCVFDSVHYQENEKHRVGFKLIPEEGLTPEKNWTFIPVRQYEEQHHRGIISDIDDTILISHATDLGKKLWLSISKNAYTRRPFPGVSEFYNLLTEDGKNPVFYVSSSDWNLYDLIRDFLNFRKIPDGPLLLKDFHVNLKNIWKSGGGGHQHKLEKIEMLFDLYPGMKFILIGDSGQHDTELYAQVIQDYPGRVLSVYIRQVRKEMNEPRKLLLQKINNIPDSPEMVFVSSTEEAIYHAKNNSLIPS